MALHPSTTRRRSAPMPHGITDKMNHFAECVADGTSLADAYRTAFDTSRMLPKTVRDEASRLLQNPGVTAAVEAIRQRREAENRMRWRSKQERIWEATWHIIDDPAVSCRLKLKALRIAAEMAGMI